MLEKDRKNPDQLCNATCFIAIDIWTICNHWSLKTNSTRWSRYLKFSNIYSTHTQRARKFKKVQAKKLSQKFFFVKFQFSAVLNFFPDQKLIFGHFSNCKKLILVKKISWNWLIWFHEFFWSGLFLIFWPTVTQ